MVARPLFAAMEATEPGKSFKKAWDSMSEENMRKFDKERYKEHR